MKEENDTLQLSCLVDKVFLIITCKHSHQHCICNNGLQNKVKLYILYMKLRTLHALTGPK